MLGSVQLVTDAIHIGGNVIDWIIAVAFNPGIYMVLVSDLTPDNFIVHCTLRTSKPHVPSAAPHTESSRASTMRLSTPTSYHLHYATW